MDIFPKTSFHKILKDNDNSCQVLDKRHTCNVSQNTCAVIFQFVNNFKQILPDEQKQGHRPFYRDHFVAVLVPCWVTVHVVEAREPMGMEDDQQQIQQGMKLAILLPEGLLL